MVVSMATAMIPMLVKIDEESVTPALQGIGKKLDGTEREIVLDFSLVHRIDSDAIRAMKVFADIGDDKSVKIVLRGVNVGVYKVLKLVKLTKRFSFAT
jgi:anti-anti-sigma regulatory factor